MGAIEIRRMSLLSVGVLAVSVLWLLTQPAMVDAGNWRMHGRSWYHQQPHYGDEGYEKHDPECGCDGVNENTDGDVSMNDCSDEAQSEDESEYVDESPNDPEDEENEPGEPSGDGLELSVDVQVQIEDGPLVDADDEASTPEANVGDVVVWQVQVRADELPAEENRTVKIVWEAPANVSVTGSSVTSGTFDGTTWTVGIGAMPATLTVNSVVTGAGLGASRARIVEISCDDSTETNPDGFCDFEDGIQANNTNPAGVIAMATSGTPNPGVSSAPGVLGASTGRPSGAVLGEQTASQQVVASRGSLAATGANTVLVFLVGGLLSLAPVAVRVRK